MAKTLEQALKESTVKIRLEGTTPMLLHNSRLANPTDPIVREIKTVTAKRKKTEEDLEVLSQLEWLGSNYWKQEPDSFDGSALEKLAQFQGIAIPQNFIKAAIITGAKKVKLGTTMKSALLVSECTPLRIPKMASPTAEQMWIAGSQFIDTRMVKVQNSRVLRTRFKVPIGWSMEIECILALEQVDISQLLECLAITAKRSGLGDYRIDQGGNFGSFTFEVI